MKNFLKQVGLTIVQQVILIGISYATTKALTSIEERFRSKKEYGFKDK